MKLELQSASNFLVHLVRMGRTNLTDQQLIHFQDAVVDVLRRRYRDHWFPEKPYKGSGYRCIRINGKLDPVIAQAGFTCGLSQELIRNTFPSELTMWIDPREVSYRIGENGSICVLYEFKDGAVNEPWKPNLHHNKNNSHSGGGNNNSTTTTPTPTPTSTNTNNNNNKKKKQQLLLLAASTPPSPPPPPSTTVSSSNIISHHHHHHHHHLHTTTTTTTTSKNDNDACKGSLRKIDFLLDSRKSVSIEQLAAYISS